MIPTLVTMATSTAIGSEVKCDIMISYNEEDLKFTTKIAGMSNLLFLINSFSSRYLNSEEKMGEI